MPTTYLRINFFVLVGVIVTLCSACVFAQERPVPPCGDTWGSRADAKAIEAAMFEGDAKAVAAAIDKAKATRGVNVGCPEASIKYDKADLTEPSLESVLKSWQIVHEPKIAAFQIGCPTAARNWGYVALGAYYAAAAGRKKDSRALRDIALLYAATQYSDANAPFPAVRQPGLFGYIAVAADDKCSDQTSIAGRPLGAIINQFCESKTFACETYDAGLFSGKKFLVADVEPATKNLDGGAAYDHAIAGVMMVEASQQLSDADGRKRFLESAKLAADWAIAEPSVRNHNYTAKLVWLLAQLYALTGEEKYRSAMLDKFDRNLKPGVLMDLNGDGIVDGTSAAKFSALTQAAQRPGRMWDGHNARPVYHAMNAFALVEAYVALRDRGDKTEAARVKPYATAMLDNLAWEAVNLGVPNSGRTQVPYAFLLGLRKIAAAENEKRPDWERALNAYLNAGGSMSEFGEGTLVTGLYLLLRSGKKYEPLGSQRQ